MLEDILKKNKSDMLDVKIIKLDRMRQYAEAVGCRRRILLSYFGEDVQQDCDSTRHL